MIYDSFLFAAESEMLTLRFLTLGPVVDYFVPVACTRTHQGEEVDQAPVEGALAEAILAAGGARTANLQWVEPQMYLDQHGKRFYRPKWERGPARSPWYQKIERQRRDGCVRSAYAAGIGDEDILMVSDVDEIPNPATVKRLADGAISRAYTMEMRMHSFGLDLQHPQWPWFGTTISRAGDSHPQRHRDQRATAWDELPEILPAEDGGWHLSWMGTPEQHDHKLLTFSHAELLGLDLRACERDAKDTNGFPLHRLDCEEMRALSWPEPLLDGSFVPPEAWWHDKRMADCFQ